MNLADGTNSLSVSMAPGYRQKYQSEPFMSHTFAHFRTYNIAGVRNTCSRHGGIHPLMTDDIPFICLLRSAAARIPSGTHSPASPVFRPRGDITGGALLTTIRCARWNALPQQESTIAAVDAFFLASDGASQCPNHQTVAKQRRPHLVISRVAHEAILRHRKSEDISRYTFDTPGPPDCRAIRNKASKGQKLTDYYTNEQDTITLCTCFTCGMFPFLPTIDYRIRIMDSRLFFEHALGHAVIF
ncbi:hypothetical protein EDB19DRAFT_313576 [Suillus lakei]|nr:hypothetical protein EDB19DRAFT_313576 [Suillus lakei]